MSEERITAIARQLGEVCRLRGRTLALAESCTGGGVGEAITRIPGSSAWLDRGFITYSNAAKEEQLATARHPHPWGGLEPRRAMHGSASLEPGTRAGVGTPARTAGRKTVGWSVCLVRGGAARVEASHSATGGFAAKPLKLPERPVERPREDPRLALDNRTFVCAIF